MAEEPGFMGLTALHDFAARARRQGEILGLRCCLRSTDFHNQGCDCSLCVDLRHARLRLKRLEQLEKEADAMQLAGSIASPDWRGFRLHEDVEMACGLDQEASPLRRCRERRVSRLPRGVRAYEGPREAREEIADAIEHALAGGYTEARPAALRRALKHIRGALDG
jgi:hypothetical protein